MDFAQEGSLPATLKKSEDTPQLSPKLSDETPRAVTMTRQESDALLMAGNVGDGVYYLRSSR